MARNQAERWENGEVQFTEKMAAALSYFAGHRNKSAAYRSAYNTENMSERCIHQKAYELFRHPIMKAAVDQMNALAAHELNIDAKWVLERAARIADFNISAFVITNEHGLPVYDFSMATDEDWYCISEMTVDHITKGVAEDMYEVERVKLKPLCKLRALELVGKHVAVQAFKENVEHTGLIGVAQIDVADFKAARTEMLDSDDC